MVTAFDDYRPDMLQRVQALRAKGAIKAWYACFNDFKVRHGPGGGRRRPIDNPPIRILTHHERVKPNHLGNSPFAGEQASFAGEQHFWSFESNSLGM